MKETARGLVLIVAVAMAVATGALLVRKARSERKPLPRARASRDPRALDLSGRTAAETEAVLRAAVKGVRAATDLDAVPSDARTDIESLYGDDYHPYFVRGDLNGDGALDFVQAFVEVRNGAPWFDVAVFFGVPGGGFRDPVFVERAITLAPGDLSIERSLLILTPDLSLDVVRRWRYEPVSQLFVDPDADPPGAGQEGPGAADDGKPRTTA